MSIFSSLVLVYLSVYLSTYLSSSSLSLSISDSLIRATESYFSFKINPNFNYMNVWDEWRCPWRSDMSDPWSGSIDGRETHLTQVSGTLLQKQYPFFASLAYLFRETIYCFTDWFFMLFTSFNPLIRLLACSFSLGQWSASLFVIVGVFIGNF